jgi:hypothetical protein
MSMVPSNIAIRKLFIFVLVVFTLLIRGTVRLKVSSSPKGPGDSTILKSLPANYVPAPQGFSSEEWEDIQNQIQQDASSLGTDFLPPKLVKKLVAGDGVANDAYGMSVSLSGDTLVVGVYQATVNGSLKQGAAYIYTRNQGGSSENWGEVKKITAFDGAANDYFGISVAISGDTVVVGASFDDIDTQNNQGSAYIFQRNQGGTDQWGLVKKIVAGDGAGSDRFGEAVAISGGVILVGAPYDDIGVETDQGSAHVFSRNNGGPDYWGEIRKLTASDGVGYNYFGASVALSGDTAVVGAWGADVLGNLGQGSSYVYTRNQGGADNWGQVKKLAASDGDDNHHFGYAVAINGQADTVVVGAYHATVIGAYRRGTAYVFDRNQGGSPDSWGQVAKLVASDGVANDNFGVSVAIKGEYVMVGAVGDESIRGAAYMYFRNQGGANTWGEIKKLQAPDGAAGDNFGIAVTGNLEADTFVVGAPGDDSWRGSAYVYSLWGNNWVREKSIIPDDSIPGDIYGYATAISGDTLVVGAYGFDSGRGAAYVFSRNWGAADNWGQVKKLTASDGAAGAQFGFSVAISGDTIVVGAFGDDDMRGAAYIFDRNQGGADKWGQVVKLTGDDTESGDWFGTSVATHSDMVVVGTPLLDDLRGAVYVFERNQGGLDNWGNLTKLTLADGEPLDSFGIALAIYGDTIAVGATGDDNHRGAAYIFTRNQGGPDAWGLVRKVIADDRQEYDYYGWPLDLNGDTILISAYMQRKAYIHTRNQGGADNWGQVVKLTSPHTYSLYQFGNGAAISGDTVALGLSEIGEKGSVYMFGRNQSGLDSWGWIKMLPAPDSGTDGDFGRNTAIYGDTLVVGEPGNSINLGNIYIYREVPLTLYFPLVMKDQ